MFNLNQQWQRLTNHKKEEDVGFVRRWSRSIHGTNLDQIAKDYNLRLYFDRNNGWE